MIALKRSYPTGVAAAAVTLCITLVSPLAHSANEVLDTNDGRLRVLTYSANEIVPITLNVGFHLHLEFSPDERFVSLGAGDTSVLDVAAEENHLFLKPRQLSGPSNMTILTTRHVYFFDYKVVAHPSKGAEPIYSIRFSYPPVPRAADSGTTEALNRQLSALPVATFQNYWYSGPPSLRPSSAVDDGIQLRLTFPPQMELPTIYAANPDGAESLVNSHFEHDILVVHRLADRFVLRRGNDSACLVDRNDRGSQRRARSGTVLDQVDRHTREPSQ